MQHRLHPDDTIAALASAPGSARRGIVRISGRATGQLLAKAKVAAAGDSDDD